MAKGVNYIFHGRLGADPTLKYVGGGQTACVNFRVAINMGEKQGTVWEECVAWGDIALAIADQFGKASKIWIKESSPSVNKWMYKGKNDISEREYEKKQWVIWAFSGEESAEEEPSDNGELPPDNIPF